MTSNVTVMRKIEKKIQQKTARFYKTSSPM